MPDGLPGADCHADPLSPWQTRLPRASWPVVANPSLQPPPLPPWSTGTQTGAAWGARGPDPEARGSGAPARERQGRPRPSPSLLCPLSWPPGASKGRQGQACRPVAGAPSRVPAGVGQQGSGLLAPGKPSGVPGAWVVPPPWQGRSGERGGLVPPHGRTKYKLS